MKNKWLQWAKQLQSISQSGFFSIDNQPELSIGRNTFEQIEMCFRAKNIEFFEVIYD